MAQRIGAATAKVWADAQEHGKCISPTPGSAEEMDCDNNEIGRTVGAANPNDTNASLYKKVGAAIEASGTFIISSPNQCPNRTPVP